MNDRPVLRQITACTAPAERVTTNSSRGRLLYELAFCPQHRRLAAKLAGVSQVNDRATQPTRRPHPRCGTLRDYQPIAKAIESHARLWLPLPDGETWLHQLQAAAAMATLTGAPYRAALADLVAVAEGSPADPAVQQRVLHRLAEIESGNLTN